MKTGRDHEFAVETFASIDTIVIQLFTTSRQAGMTQKYPLPWMIGRPGG